MPTAPKRPADVVGNAIRVVQIATGKREEEYEPVVEDKRNPAEGGTGGVGLAREGRKFKLRHDDLWWLVAGWGDIPGERQAVTRPTPTAAALSNVIRALHSAERYGADRDPGHRPSWT